jgi:hypothetical protein
LLSNSLVTKQRFISCSTPEYHPGILAQLYRTDPLFVKITCHDSLQVLPTVLTWDQNLCFTNGSDGSTKMKWICFSFDCCVSVLVYHLKSWNVHSYLISWRVEGSADGFDWELLDERQNGTSLCGKFAESQFACQHQGVYSIIKLTMTGVDLSNQYWFLLSGIEFYGFIFEYY